MRKHASGVLNIFWFDAIQSRISCKIYSEPLKHAFSSCEGLVERVCNSFKNPLRALWFRYMIFPAISIKNDLVKYHTHDKWTGGCTDMKLKIEIYLS